MHKVTLIEGDWVGPELCSATRRVIDATGVSIDWKIVSPNTIDWDSLKSEASVILKARTAAPIKDGALPFAVEIRKQLGLYCTIRRAKALQGTSAKFPNIDVVVFRETSEDIYSGFEHQVTEGVFEAVKITTEAACERIAKAAYEYAVEYGRKKITIVHKSNIMKQSDGLFLRTAQRIGKEYPQIETEEYIVDALCMRLVQNPYRFDVLLTANLFGDIVSDLCSGLAGGIVASPSYSFGYNEQGEKIQLFENLHGKVPEWVGKDKANPIPMLNASILMLRELDEIEAADRMSSGIISVLSDGIYTEDLGGTASTSIFIEALIQKIS
jgi:isocitrate dehydrogenase (NAD+)